MKFTTSAPSGEGPHMGKKTMIRAYFVGSTVAVGGILYGYDTGLISGILAMPEFKNQFSTGFRNSEGDLDFNSSQSSLIVSILSAGTFCGALSSALFADLLGRKWALITSNIMFMFGVLLQTIAQALPLFNAGRFFAGLGIGLLSPLVPLYLSETSPKEVRGSIVTMYPWIVTWGLFIAAIVNNATKNRKDSGAYRIPIAIQFLFSLMIIAAMLCLPETPRLLVKKSKVDVAEEALCRLRKLPASDPLIISELNEIKTAHEAEQERGKAPFKTTFRGTVGKRLLTGCMIQAFSQLCGINFIFYYGTPFFLSTGIKNPFLVQVITNSVNVAFTVPGLLLADRWGRRGLLLLGACGMAISQLIVAITGTAAPNSGVANIVLVACVCVFIASFAMSWAPCGWIVTGELFPLNVRAKCLAITTATNWICNWALAFATPYLVDEGPGNAGLGVQVFFVWGSCALIAAILVFLMVYETRGLSLEMVDALYAATNKAWKSKAHLPYLREHAEFVSVVPAADVAGGERKFSKSYTEKIEV